MNSKTTLPLLDAAAHDEVMDVLRRLTVAYPDTTSNEVACSVARCALEHACWDAGGPGPQAVLGPFRV